MTVATDASYTTRWHLTPISTRTQTHHPSATRLGPVCLVAVVRAPGSARFTTVTAASNPQGTRVLFRTHSKVVVAELASFRVTMVHHDPGTELTVVGELDVGTSGQLADHLRQAIDADDGDVAIDLAGITFIDSTGLKILVGGHTQLVTTGRRLVLRHPSTPVVRLFTVAGLADYFTIETTPA